jgi:DNA (cytosine-5)-methyltransferase 1
MIKILSLFSGAGGIDIGFKNNSFETYAAIDNWQVACDTLKANKISKNVIYSNIKDVDFSYFKGKVECIVGGPPCPPYSKSRFYIKEKKRALEDVESFTLVYFCKALEIIKPKVFFFENVHGFFFKPHKAALDFFETECKKSGYDLSYKVINCADYGIPQIRQRFICIGSLKKFGKFSFPETTHSNKKKLDLFHLNKKEWINCNEAIGDLDINLPEDKDNLAGSKHKNLLKQIPPGQNYLFFTKERGNKNPKFKWRSRYWSFLLKLSPKEPSWTIQASFSNNMGPFHWKNRFLRINEIKRIQTFPDNYKLMGDFKDQWRLVGNAVPPLLAKVISGEIKKQFFS